MPNPPAQPPTLLQSQVGFTAGGGPALSPDPTQVNTLPSVQPPISATASSTPQLLGFDAVQFSFALNGGLGTQTVTFPQLPYRNNTANPLAVNTNAGQQTYTPQPIDLLMLDVSLQFNLQTTAIPAGTVIGAIGQAITSANVRVLGPFLGHDTYVTFQAVVTASSSVMTGPVAGFVVARLWLSKG